MKTVTRFINEKIGRAKEIWYNKETWPIYPISIPIFFLALLGAALHLLYSLRAM